MRFRNKPQHRQGETLHVLLVLSNAGWPLKGTTIVQCELIKNNSYGSALQYGRRILLYNLFKAFYAGLGQLNEADALLHDRGHASDEASVD